MYLRGAQKIYLFLSSLRYEGINNILKRPEICTSRRPVSSRNGTLSSKLTDYSPTNNNRSSPNLSNLFILNAFTQTWTDATDMLEGPFISRFYSSLFFINRREESMEWRLSIYHVVLIMVVVFYIEGVSVVL